MGVRKYNVGEVYNHLEILDFPPAKNGRARVSCRCSCGNIVERDCQDVVKSRCKSCGCVKDERKPAKHDIAGDKFASLTAVEKIRVDGKNSVWKFICGCGNTIECQRRSVTQGKRKSCGCEKIQDMTGQKFGRLTVIKQNGKDASDYRWDCVCDCGNEHNASGAHLRRGNIRSCGCLREEVDISIDITGDRYGRLKVISREENLKGRTRWKCLCDCGEYTVVDTRALRASHAGVRSCGCLLKDVRRESRIDITGERYGLLVGIKEVEDRAGMSWWLFKCECGKTVEAPKASIRSGKRTSCGCDKLSCQIGDTIGYITILDREIVDNVSYWKCVCVCGEQLEIRAGFLNRETASCGCMTQKLMSTPRLDLAGKKFGRWLVLENIEDDRSGSWWKCVCECGTESVKNGSALNLGYSISCGCKHRENNALRRGANHPSWNPDLTDEDRMRKRKVLENSEWRKDVFERDNYTCKICKERGGVINAHHLDSWHWCKERRFDLDNGVCLCKCCHTEFHKIYGNKDNTAEEFFEYYLVKGQI